MDFPGGSDGKESACNMRDLGSIPGLGRSPGEGNGYPLQRSALENPHGQRSLADYSPWGCKESDMTSVFGSTPANILSSYSHSSLLYAEAEGALGVGVFSVPSGSFRGFHSHILVSD